jgi:FAD/FMN-containing dehydrogenase
MREYQFLNKPLSIHRRKFLALSLAEVGLLSLSMPSPAYAADMLVPNVSGLFAVSVARIDRPRTNAQVAASIRNWPGKVAIGGGRYSMGGQTGVRGGLHLDMRSLNGLIWLKPASRCIRVQAGMQWRDLQDIIDPHDLAVMTMQSFSNFSVGGSVSVNVHGRYVGNGPICNSVRALQIVLADGSVIEADRHHNTELFRAAIGGYGAIGVITEVELDLVDNIRIERMEQRVPLNQYPAFFKKNIESDKTSVLHNADLIPPNFDTPVAITWKSTIKPLTEQQRLVPRGQTYKLQQNLIWALTELPYAERLHAEIRPLLLDKKVVKWRNHEASRDAAELEPRSRSHDTYVLQEYFIPVRHFVPFATAIAKLLLQHEVEALNVSIRHSRPDTISMLPWAREEVFSFVLYHKHETSPKALETVGHWTRQLIELALTNEGRYYLPYQLHADRQQFERAYPEVQRLRKLKSSVDPLNKFSNELWTKYL